MPISWYPGHMHKARKQLTTTIRATDVIIEVLDARAPGASSNPLLAELRGDLPSVKILNKADLADPETTRSWQRYFSHQPDSICLPNGHDEPLSRQALVSACRKLVTPKSDPIAQYQALITGVPNVGKSTLLNHWLGRKIAKTGNEPAVTRAQQKVRLESNWFLIDTPGMMWPKLEDQQAACRLAALGSIRNTALDLEEIGWSIAEILLDEFFPLLKDRYCLTDKPVDVETLLTTLARANGCLARGGAVDWQRVSELLLGDLRSGRLGRISLEPPPTTTQPITH